MSASSASTAPPRRIQARGEATRRRILEATLACIVEEGYAQTSTVHVCQRSGAARGSLLHQFPTRAALMAAAVAHLFETLTSEYIQAFTALQAEATDDVVQRLHLAGALLLASFGEPRLAAVLDIYAAARTDPDLMAALRPVAVRHRRAVRELAHRFFPATATSPRVARRLEVVLDALQGLAFRSVVLPEGAQDTIDGARELLAEALLEAAEPEGAPTASTASTRSNPSK